MSGRVSRVPRKTHVRKDQARVVGIAKRLFAALSD